MQEKHGDVGRRSILNFKDPFEDNFLILYLKSNCTFETCYRVLSK